MSLATRNDRLAHPLDGLTNDLDAFVQRVFGHEAKPVSPYGVDVYEDADHVYIDAELPGFSREAIDVTVHNDLLTVRAQREPKRVEGEKTAWLVRERRFHRFERSFTLPKTVDGTTVDAKYADGVLHLTLNKRAEAKPRKIAIA